MRKVKVLQRPLCVQRDDRRCRGIWTMWTRQHKQRNTGRLIIPSLCVAFLAYFGFHAYHGEFGIYSKYQLEAETVDLQGKLDAVKARRVDLERRVQLMHEGTLEKDMLDEQARKALNLSQADEITIMLSAKAK
jgi:cell division protein FtsB